MRLIVLSALATVAVAVTNSNWWIFDAWDGLSCGDSPQNAELLFDIQGLGNQFCINFDKGQRAYSYAASFSDDEVEVEGYLQEHCEGQGRALFNNSCMNPDIEIPYIRSWRINTVKQE